MSVMDWFRNPAPQAQPQQMPQTQNGQQQQAPTPTMQQGQQQPDPTAQSVEPQTPKDPMESFKDLWAPAAKVEGAEEEFNPSQIFNLDPASVQKAVGQINFADGITEDQLAAISGGGADAVKTFAEILNSSSSKAMAMSTTAAAKMIEQAMTRASGAMDKKIDRSSKLNQVSSQLQELNPALNSPAAAPILEAVKQQLLNKYPTSSSAEITKLATQYLENFAGIAAGKKEEPKPDPAKQGTDWEAYLTL